MQNLLPGFLCRIYPWLEELPSCRTGSTHSRLPILIHSFIQSFIHAFIYSSIWLSIHLSMFHLSIHSTIKFLLIHLSNALFLYSHNINPFFQLCHCSSIPDIIHVFIPSIIYSSIHWLTFWPLGIIEPLSSSVLALEYPIVMPMSSQQNSLKQNSFL